MTGDFSPSRSWVTLLLLVAASTIHLCFSLSVAGTRGKLTLESGSSEARRSMLRFLSMFPVVVVTPKASCKAQDETSSDRQGRPRGGKPFASLAALLPAARLKTVVDQMYDLSTTLPKSSKEVQCQTLTRMNQIWTNRPPIFRKNEKLPRRIVVPSATQFTTSIPSAKWDEQRPFYPDLSLPDRAAALLNRADMERQWGMLQYQESQRERGNEPRAALNYYSWQLEFDGHSYLLTASQEDRKRLIRDDRLPSLTSVIASDLDLRDLYRNAFLTSFEDELAELAYQLQRPPAQVDVTDVVELMEQAHGSIGKWFDLIAPADVQEAMEAVQKE